MWSRFQTRLSISLTHTRHGLTRSSIWRHRRLLAASATRFCRHGDWQWWGSGAAANEAEPFVDCVCPHDPDATVLLHVFFFPSSRDLIQGRPVAKTDTLNQLLQMLSQIHNLDLVWLFWWRAEKLLKNNTKGENDNVISVFVLNKYNNNPLT